MSFELTSDDFAAFFREIHGNQPFPWQERLVRRLAENSRQPDSERVWPEVLDLPTGSGKTAALDAAVFHLALGALRGPERRAPVRIVLVVDRRLVVDDTFERARRIAKALEKPEGDVTAEVARRLKFLAGEDAPPLLARRLRGGVPREDDWARTPSQPTILCSTVDQVGSRLLFRGYGVSDSMKPMHAGLLGSDCLILLDEAHLSEPFRQTLGWVQCYRSPAWRENNDAVPPWESALLTATPGSAGKDRFGLEAEDVANPILRKRWKVQKPALLINLGKEEKTEDEEDTGPDKGGEKQRIATLVQQVKAALAKLRERGTANPALAVVANRVARARSVFGELSKEFGQQETDLLLLIGPSRSVERDALANKLGPIHTGKSGSSRELEKPLLIVSTQCIEAGVDIDLDGLVTEAAPLDALRQRFGRLNRAGRDIVPYAATVGSGGKQDAKDPVYGEAIVETWKYLTEFPDKPAGKKPETPAEVDFGLQAFEERLKQHPVEDLKKLLSPKEDAPILMPAHLDLLSQTSPVPSADPEVSLYLHGPSRTADAVSVVWRADVDPEFMDNAATFRLMELAPARAAEAIALPVWAVRGWLAKQKSNLAQLADISSTEPDAEKKIGAERLVFQWTGDETSSRWIAANSLKPGDSIIVPASYGGADEYGWNPNADGLVKDVAAKAAEPFAGRRFVVRVGPGLLHDPSKEDEPGMEKSRQLASDKEEQLAKALAEVSTQGWKAIQQAVLSIGLPQGICDDLKKLEHANRYKVQRFTDVYGEKDECPRGVVFVAPLGIKVDPEGTSAQDASPDSTENDAIGSLSGLEVSLKDHCEGVEKKAEHFARSAGLSDDCIADLKLAGHLHDLGKADSRFQRWLAYGDPLGPDPNSDKVLAKSARPLPWQARRWSDLPDRWRHEALSVRLAPNILRFNEARDPELVLWLVGTHHGHGRPLFPHSDPEDEKDRSGLPRILGLPETLAAGPGPQSLAFDRQGLDWPGLYELLKRRYGVWDLARMEAILRLADHRASQEEKPR